MDSADASAAMVSLRKIIRFLRVSDREIETATGLSAAQLFVLTTLADTPALSLAEIAARADRSELGIDGRGEARQERAD